eukprot:scaffold68216_cov19-Tisochrysis_lutea.AAC.6
MASFKEELYGHAKHLSPNVVFQGGIVWPRKAPDWVHPLMCPLAAKSKNREGLFLKTPVPGCVESYFPAQVGRRLGRDIEGRQKSRSMKLDVLPHHLLTSPFLTKCFINWNANLTCIPCSKFVATHIVPACTGLSALVKKKMLGEIALASRVTSRCQNMDTVQSVMRLFVAKQNRCLAGAIFLDLLIIVS